MRSTLVNFDPVAEMRAMDTLLERLFGEPQSTFSQAPSSSANVPIAVYEKDNKVVVKASVPGVDPENIDISIDNGVLTIRGESKLEDEFKDAKVYRREFSHGTFTRSVRLHDQLDLDKIDAEFKNGFVTITIPSLAEPRSRAVKVPLRSGENKQSLPKAPANSQDGRN